MQKVGVRVVFGLFLVSLLFLSFVSAEEDSMVLDELINEHPDEVIEGANLKPGDFFYFVDEFFNQFQDEISLKEEYMAEVFALLEEERYDEAKEAFKKYQSYAERVEKEVSPDEREEARKSSAAIVRALRELEGDISDAEIEELFDEVLEEEEEIITAAEIASRIEELCSELHETGNYELFYKTCKTEDDSPEWQKELYEDFTDEQVKEAEAFIKKISVCFEDAANCPCEEFENKEFSQMCSKIAPLVAACEAGDEEACREEESIDFDPFDVLPPHIVAAMEEKFGGFDGGDDYDRLPPECEGVSDMIACENKLFREHAPEECVEAFEKEGLEINEKFDTEDAHKFCEKVLYEVHTPIECQEKNLNDEECRKEIFVKHAPKECLEAGLTGEYEDDNYKCDEIMEHAYEVDKEFDHYAFGAACQDIDDPDARLDCYDAALGNGEFDFEEYYDDKYKEENDYEEYDYYEDDKYYEDKEYYEDEYDKDYDEYNKEYDEYEDKDYYDEEYEKEYDEYEDYDKEEKDRDHEEEKHEHDEEYDDAGNLITGNVVVTNDIYYKNPYLRYFYGLLD